MWITDFNQKTAEVLKMPVSRAESPPSAARFVSLRFWIE